MARGNKKNKGQQKQTPIQENKQITESTLPTEGELNTQDEPEKKQKTPASVHQQLPKIETVTQENQQGSKDVENDLVAATCKPQELGNLPLDVQTVSIPPLDPNPCENLPEQTVTTKNEDPIVQQNKQSQKQPQLEVKVQQEPQQQLQEKVQPEVQQEQKTQSPQQAQQRQKAPATQEIQKEEKETEPINNTTADKQTVQQPVKVNDYSIEILQGSVSQQAGPRQNLKQVEASKQEEKSVEQYNKEPQTENVQQKNVDKPVPEQSNVEPQVQAQASKNEQQIGQIQQQEKQVKPESVKSKKQEEQNGQSEIIVMDKAVNQSESAIPIATIQGYPITLNQDQNKIFRMVESEEMSATQSKQINVLESIEAVAEKENQMKESQSFSELNVQESIRSNNDFNKNNSVKQAQTDKIPEQPVNKEISRLSQVQSNVSNNIEAIPQAIKQELPNQIPIKQEQKELSISESKPSQPNYKDVIHPVQVQSEQQQSLLQSKVEDVPSAQLPVQDEPHKPKDNKTPSNLSKVLISSAATIVVGGIAWFAGGKNPQKAAFAGIIALGASLALNK